MTAPLQKFSGASVAQTVCATGEFAPRLKPAAQTRATASLPVAQTQQAGFDQQGQIRANGASAAMQHFNSNGEATMENKTTDQLILELVAINDELYARGESPIKIIRDRTLKVLPRTANGKLKSARATK